MAKVKLCNETITIYNAYHDPVNDCNSYTRTVVTGVSWYGSVKSTVTDKGLKTANQYTLRIPADADFGGSSYVPPNVFKSAADHDGMFTLNEGDLIVRGVAAEENPLPSALHSRYEALTVLGVTDNRRAPNAPHWKVVGA